LALGVQNRDRRGEERCRGERVESIHQSAVAGNEAARILDAETPLERRFEQIAKLGHDRRRQAKPEQRREAVRPRRENEAEDRTVERSADRPGPGLAWRDAGLKRWAADQPGGEISGDVGSPDDRE